MKFLYYDVAFLVLFCLFLVVFLIKKKKNLKVESKVFFLYPTKFGLEFINKSAKQHKKLLHIASYFVISIGYILMIASIWLFIEMVKNLIEIPLLSKMMKIPPIMPIFPYFTQAFKIDYLPPFYFTYWIIAIGVIALSHEFAHGIFSKFYGVKVKSTGFGFLGPFIAAFVEPDEKQLIKKNNFSQIVILSAGSFANVIMTLLFGIIMIAFAKIFFFPAGVIFDTYLTTNVNVTDITQIGMINTSNLSTSQFIYLINNTDSNNPDFIATINNRYINLTKINAYGKEFLSPKELMLALALSAQNKSIPAEIIVFDDAPAIKMGIAGAISKINSQKIDSVESLRRELSKYKPYEEITVETINQNYERKTVSLTLSANSKNKSQAILGIGFLQNPDTLSSKLASFAQKIGKKIRDTAIFYVPIAFPSLMIFIYNLLWWIVLLNISVALMNMLPLSGVFDGGKVFYLTMLVLTKSKNKAEIISKIMKWLLVLLLILIMVIWWVNTR
ncbi:MAG: site-2 protease family protein [archaeon]